MLDISIEIIIKTEKRKKENTQQILIKIFPNKKVLFESVEETNTSRQEMLKFRENYFEKLKFSSSKESNDINVGIKHILILKKYSIEKNILSISLVM